MVLMNMCRLELVSELGLHVLFFGLAFYYCLFIPSWMFNQGVNRRGSVDIRDDTYKPNRKR